MNRCVSNGLMVWNVKETKKKENKSEMSDVELFFIYLFIFLKSKVSFLWNQNKIKERERKKKIFFLSFKIK